MRDSNVWKVLEWFLALPVAVVLAALWLGGTGVMLLATYGIVLGVERVAGMLIHTA